MRAFPGRQPVRQATLAAADPQATAELIRQVYVDLDVRVRRLGPDLRHRISTVEVEQIAADRVDSFQFDMRAATEPFANLTAFTLLKGRTRLRTGRGSAYQEAIPQVGQGCLYPHDRPVIIDYPYGEPPATGPMEISVSSLRLPWATVARLAEESTGLPAADLRFTALQPLPGAAAHWYRTFDFVHRQLLAPQTVMANRLVAENMAATLAAAALAAFPNTTMAAARLPRPGRAAPAVVRRAVDFIEAHADVPLTLTHIAAAVRTSPRALRQAFLRHLDTTPTAYLHRVRLERAHADLLGTAGQTVERIALRWGFADPARFAVAYQQAYGVTPGLTLRD
ncbi:helix-turn-helix transcriptional regulator [Actinomadura kijaniata]|uniref:helix-turn-helix transcriptional regulator n=1 Tax=Actinomadura kijaniata TaxID=46161 RepID=UPI0008312E81|nr:helix-turn-helix transcriptional regulator [Actinomadura kijaniata]